MMGGQKMPQREKRHGPDKHTYGDHRIQAYANDYTSHTKRLRCSCGRFVCNTNIAGREYDGWHRAGAVVCEWCLRSEVTQVVWRYSRWHHYVDYHVFKGNKLQKKPGAVIPEGVNEYGIRLAIMNAGNQQPQPNAKVGGRMYDV